MVAVVGVVVLCDDVLQVGVLPVQVAGLDRSREHGPVQPGEWIWGEEQAQELLETWNPWAMQLDHCSSSQLISEYLNTQL